MKINSFIFVFTVSMLLTSFVSAQDNYIPPPLFAEPRDPPPRAKVPETKMPRLSKKVEDIPDDEISDKLLIKPRVVPAEVPIPPKAKPIVPQKKEIKDKALPPPILKPVNSPAKSKGVVKGPKVMPAVKKENVDTEITYENENSKPANILERVQPEIAKDTVIEKKQAQPITDVQMIDSMMLGYKENESALSAEHKIKLYSKIIPVIRKDTSLSISIEAYASPQNGQMNSDRRLALSRAMAIRAYLIDQDIEPQRINVRSLGAQSNIAPLDRVEITLAP